MATASPAPESLAHFHFFSFLPVELRRKVWKLSGSVPRTVNLFLKWERIYPTSGLFPTPTTPTRTFYRFFCPDPVPALLQACQESRAVAQGILTPAFCLENRERHVWVNFGLDTIKLPDLALAMVHVQERMQIRRLAMIVDDCFVFSEEFENDMSEMNALQELEIISLEGILEWRDVLDHLPTKFGKWFGGVDGWLQPNVRIVEEATGLELNYSNFKTLVPELARERSRRIDAGEIDVHDGMHPRQKADLKHLGKRGRGNGPKLKGK